MDTSAFVEARRRLYPASNLPFWGFLAKHIEAGSICSPTQVFKEVCEGTDWLKEFVKARPGGLNIKTERRIQDGMRVVADHVKSQYPLRRWSDFLSGGDAWVIACALKIVGTVVTEESAHLKKKIRIPVVCERLVVRHTDIEGMLSHFGESFRRAAGA
jgi:hypothetical protein